MTEPLKQDQRVIADTSIDGVYPDGTAYVMPIVIGEEGKDFWRWPLTDEMVERLAKSAYDAFWFDGSWNDPMATSENERNDWRKIVRTVFTELMGDN